VASLTVHEWGHAASAWWLGDDTAARSGRLTLNPLPHIDPIGTLLIPSLMLLSSGMGVTIPLFGWAKPVPVNSSRFTRKISLRAGEALTAAAGPATNLILAFLAALALGIIGGLKPDWLITVDAGGQVERPLLLILHGLLRLNVALAFFNLIPVPPLDGGWILQWLVPYRYQWVVSALARRGMIILLIAVFGPGYLRGMVPPGLTAMLPDFLGPSAVLRLLAAGGCGVAAFVSLQALARAKAAGRPGSAVSHESALEWTLPLAVALATAQVSMWLIMLGVYGLRWLANGLLVLLGGLG